MSISKRLHISFIPSIPTSGPGDLEKSLATHLGRFGTVKSIDGFGDLDGVGLPKKFGFVSIEGSEASITKCVNSFSGSIWKGVKVRVGDARPNFDQRIARENATELSPLRRKRKRAGGAFAEDMTLVTPENAAGRPGWKVTEMGRVVRPIRMRPERPLPPPLAGATAVSKRSTVASDSKKRARKAKKRRDPDSRARRRTIDVTRWGSVHLKGVFLENAGQAPPQLSRDKDVHDQHCDDDSSVSVSDGEWGGRESVGSDVDEAELLKIGGTLNAEDFDAVEFVPMDMDNGTSAIPSSNVALDLHVPTSLPPPPPAKKATQLKDLFAPREEDAGFSLLGHLDLDLELEDEFAHLVPTPASLAATAPDPGSQTTTLFTPGAAHTQIVLDPKQPLFFPLQTSLSAGMGSVKARQRDILDVGKDNGWNAHFGRTETDDEIRAKWESEKVDLTRDWNRRWREAGKVRRRRGGGLEGE
ncbi:hypothetical protein GGX14DRAFT_349652 [Mycena pura]|uniref:RRM domain-containing protein n=1 Tax=Mycena pura TaxID=153505 RepID=A0AAD6YQG2_9AGAR|nr:hypothetical protein GGX14DRAFT_349652 [Mycena pura]